MNYEPMTRGSYWRQIGRMLLSKNGRRFLWTWYRGDQQTRHLLATQMQNPANRKEEYR